MNSRIIVPYSLCVLLVGSVMLAQERTEDLIRDVPPGGSISIGYSPLVPSLELPAVVALSDVAVEGEIVSSVSEQTRAPYYVSTTYVMRVQNVLFDRTPIFKAPTAAMSMISFTRIGGRIWFQGHEIVTIDTTLPAFEPRAHLFVFLKREADGEFVNVGGPSGAYGVQDGMIESFWPVGTPINDRYGRVDVATSER